MANADKCDICGISIETEDQIDYTNGGMRIHACAKCAQQIEGLKYEATKAQSTHYLQNQLQQTESSLFGKTFIQDILRESKQYTPKQQYVPNQKSPESDNTSDLPKYKDPISTIIVGIVAALCLAGSVVITIMGFTTGSNGHEALVYFGIGGIIISVFLFVIMNMSMDIHHMDYNIATLTEDNRHLQKEIIRLLKEKQ